MPERADPNKAPTGPQPTAESPLVLIDHRPDILGGEAHGFGCLLFDLDGRLVVKDGLTWLYTTRLAGETWESWVRPFDPESITYGAPSRILLPAPGEGRAVLHHVIALGDDLFVGFYCNGVGIRAAVAVAPDAPFEADASFVFEPEAGWETRGGALDGWSLESNGAHIRSHDRAGAAELWLGYDSYRQDGRQGDLGWARVRVDRRRRQVTLLDRHQDNPLPFRDPRWRCVRCGGNLSSDVRIRGRRAYFYYVRPDESDLLIGLALSDDPFFLRNTEHFIVDKVAGDELVAEKFQALQREDTVLLFYENKLTDGTWHTAMRRYAMRRKPAVP